MSGKVTTPSIISKQPSDAQLALASDDKTATIKKVTNPAQNRKIVHTTKNTANGKQYNRNKAHLFIATKEKTSKDASKAVKNSFFQECNFTTAVTEQNEEIQPRSPCEYNQFGSLKYAAGAMTTCNRRIEQAKISFKSNSTYKLPSLPNNYNSLTTRSNQVMPQPSMMSNTMSLNDLFDSNPKEQGYLPFYLRQDRPEYRSQAQLNEFASADKQDTDKKDGTESTTLSKYSRRKTLNLKAKNPPKKKDILWEKAQIRDEALIKSVVDIKKFRMQKNISSNQNKNPLTTLPPLEHSQKNIRLSQLQSPTAAPNKN